MKLCALPAALLVTLATTLSAATTIPTTTGTALDGHTLTLPHDLSTPATVLIVGFTRGSSDATTAWGKSIRTALATTPAIDYYDIAFLQDAPSFIRPLILRNIRKQVPDALKPHFLPLTSNEAAWKQVVNFSPSAPDAAYVLLIDRSGNIRYLTHEPYTPTRLNDLSTSARTLASATP
jgi:hypothetical protein